MGILFGFGLGSIWDLKLKDGMGFGWCNLGVILGYEFGSFEFSRFWRDFLTMKGFLGGFLDGIGLRLGWVGQTRVKI